MQDEKTFYLKKRMEQLEVENDSMKENIMQTNMVVKEFIPRLSQLLGGERILISLDTLTNFNNNIGAFD